MNGPILALILFVLIVLIYYKYENYFLFIPKTISLFLTFTLLVIPQYADALPNYVYYKTQLLNYNQTNISNKNKKYILNNQNNECYYCKNNIKNYIIRQNTPNSKDLSNYIAICYKCNDKIINRNIKK